MEFKGTKGKWTNKELGVFSEENRQIASCYLMSFNYDARGRQVKDTMGIANAKLISCAPELLESLKELLDEFYQENATAYEFEICYKAKELIKKATE